MELVVNEWLPEYLIADENTVENKIVIEFLNKFLNSNDLLLVKAQSPFTDKINRYPKKFSGYPHISKNFGKLLGVILRDSLKTKLLYEQDFKQVHIPQVTHDLLTIPNTNFYSDYYLFETANLSADRLIITTDLALANHMKRDANFKVVMLSDFMKYYQI